MATTDRGEWKYIGCEHPDDARDHFCVNSKETPVVELENGMFAVWIGAPLQAASEYPQLHHKPLGQTAYDYVR